PQSPAPAKAPRKPPVPKPPKLTVTEAAQKLMAIQERITDPHLELATIEEELRAFDAMAKPDLLKLVQEVGMTIPPGLTKEKVLEEIRRRVRDRKGSYDRTRFRPESAEMR